LARRSGAPSQARRRAARARNPSCNIRSRRLHRARQLKYKAIKRTSDIGRTDLDRVSIFECMIDPDTGEYLSEDYAFCRRWLALGGEIWLDRAS